MKEDSKKLNPSAHKMELARACAEKYVTIAKKEGSQFSKRWMGSILFLENPSVFKDAEDGRKAILYVTNCMGAKDRRLKNEDLAREISMLHEPLREDESTEPFIVPTSIKKTLWIADVHGLFYDPKAFELAVGYGIKQNCDSVIILGDFMDYYGYSKFDKNPLLKGRFYEEKEWGQDTLQLLQKAFGTVILKKGNHDARREDYIAKRMDDPDIIQMSKYSDHLFFDGCHVNFIDYGQKIYYGKLTGIHGHEYQGGGGINVARNRLLKAKVNVMSAHSHIAQSTITKTLRHDVLGSWTLGCLCFLHPHYAPENEWTQGFAVTEKDSSGNFEVNNRTIIGSKTVNA